MLASASYDKAARLWDTGSGVALKSFKGYSAPVNAVTFSKDSKMLASASGDSTGTKIAKTEYRSSIYRPKALLRDSMGPLTRIGDIFLRTVEVPQSSGCMK
jgi:WD40 repeat protein